MPLRGKQASGLLTQQKMLRAAVKLFLEKGYEGTTTAEIARAAGMTPSSFFRAFPSKEALLLELDKRMFSGQFALAEQHSTAQDPVLLYAVETAIQLHIAELTEPLRELYVTAYTLPSTSAYLYRSTAKRLEGIFDRFVQADASISRKYRGSGLGLSLVKKTAEALGGTVAVESTLGEGSTFTVRIPVEVIEFGEEDER